ncbi:type I polyketide synthase [Paenibacillus pini]|uniref:Malonyl CoA-acyl carrier protein transacylase n=1 Tax=Paenibacillus pini JCM 16418 TaxID=1236976 RepID=W7YD27_9BACL|nr:type I polyketide synthase [Paenibacillus pini]GAF06372.1 malonyl CoA-acyl carrier protein transacylase [Paenibacillus pini JCM 16418]
MSFKHIGANPKNHNISSNNVLSINRVSKHEIAVIGISGMFAGAEDVNQYWELLSSGTDCNREFPIERRADVEEYMEFLRNHGFSQEGLEYSIGGFMPEIDKFDPSFFHLSPREAALMEPKQKMMLQTMWSAVEDAGYGGDQINGSRTGVFLGDSNDFYDGYRQHLLLQNVDDYGHSVTSNIHSVMASRIAYLLDLKGPAIMIDTACSSALVAIHMACQSIRNQECDMALAGGINILLTPYRGEKRWEIGIQAADGRAKTFDDRSDGTGSGEGAGAVLLKPLYRALQDNDTIYAVIKGSAMNQDGTSAGLTTPNAAAQEQLIIQAWQDADVDPETISYIEAHGTGTKLGDPIEISGITRAFSKFTTKKQFCAVGSVKPNIGHLDNCAGIAGFIKCLMALKHKELPPSIQFETPNRKISFVDSPVYVNDTLQPWISGGGPRRCGISAFGLSGTNCHLVLEEAPDRTDQYFSLNENREFVSPGLFTVSAQSEEGIGELLKRYESVIHSIGSTQPDLMNYENYCYTATTGRGHYTHRLAILTDGIEGLLCRIRSLIDGTLITDEQKGIYYGVHKKVSDVKRSRQVGEMTDRAKAELDAESDSKIQQALLEPNEREPLQAIAQLYILGATVKWELLFNSHKYRRVQLPTYPFRKIRSWNSKVQSQKAISAPVNEMQRDGLNHAVNHKNLHPVLHQLVAETPELTIFSTDFDVNDHWVLNEHKVLGNYVVPGTTYLEMAREIGYRLLKSHLLLLSGVTFLSPLMVKPGEKVHAQIVAKNEAGGISFSIISRTDQNADWVTHAEGSIKALSPQKMDSEQEVLSLEAIKLRSMTERVIDYDDLQTGAIDTGPRWNNVERIFIGENEALLKLMLPDPYLTDLDVYTLHPALMDCAANAANVAFGGGTYLPYMYKSFSVSGPTPAVFYSYVIKKSEQHGGETETFDITMADEAGKVFVRIHDYTIKRVDDKRGLAVSSAECYQPRWVPAPIALANEPQVTGTVLLWMDDQGIGSSLSELLRSKGRHVIELFEGEQYEQISDDSYSLSLSEEHFIQMWEDVREAGVTHFIYLGALSGPDHAKERTELALQMERGVHGLFHLARSFAAAKWKLPLEWLVVTSGAVVVDGKERVIRPHHAAMAGLGKVLNQEFPNLQVRFMDMDEVLPEVSIEQELYGLLEERDFHVAYRDGIRYTLEIAPLKQNLRADHEVVVKAGGTYLITGGTGGIGLELASYLSSLAPVNLILINRSLVPERQEWQPIVDAGTDHKMSARITRLQAIENNGSQLHCYRADVSDEAEMISVLEEVSRDYGPIHGVIHAAGVAGDGMILRKESAVFTNVLAPKIQGAWLLDKYVNSEHLDFFVLLSSVTAITGGLGQGDYTAANSYLDAFAHHRRLEGKPALSINWPAWKETGMAVNYGVHDAPAVWKSLATHKALQYFDLLLHSGVPQAIAGELDMETTANLIDQLPFRFTSKVESGIRRKRAITDPLQYTNQSAQAVLTLTGKSETDISPLEQQVAQIWATVLGLEELDVYESFYDMGGDSILAAQLYRKLDQHFPQTVDISDIFSYPSVIEMAEYLDSLQQKEISRNNVVPQANAGQEIDADDEVDALLARVISGEITPEEASKLVSEG